MNKDEAVVALRQRREASMDMTWAFDPEERIVTRGPAGEFVYAPCESCGTPLEPTQPSRAIVVRGQTISRRLCADCEAMYDAGFVDAMELEIFEDD